MRAILLLASLTAAQTPPPTPAQPPAPPSCTGPEHRLFDFWVGDWTVHDAKGQQVGTNRIEKVENGCGLAESWRSAGGGTGRSLNFYRPATKSWFQAWVGGGTALILEGQFDGQRMRLEGDSLGPKGVRLHNRITWSPLDGGKVRQMWEQSVDAGKTWTVAFDGTYSRAGVRPD
jgi:hypothetical protein